jgi:hypothetical protein
MAHKSGDTESDSSRLQIDVLAREDLASSFVGPRIGLFLGSAAVRRLATRGCEPWIADG